MRTALPLALILAAGCQKNESTPPGTAILDWQRAQSTLPSAVSATERGSRSIKDHTVLVRPKQKGPVTLSLHVETASLDMEEDGAKIMAPTPVAVRITAEKNQDWTLKTQCGSMAHRPPSYVAVVPSRDIVLTCTVILDYKDTFNQLNHGLILEIGGDDSVQTTFEGGTVTVD
jgi:hypothetical protein